MENPHASFDSSEPAPSPEKEVHSNIKTELVEGNISGLYRALNKLDKEAFGENPAFGMWSYDRLRPDDVLIILRDQDDEKVIGYTYAKASSREEKTAHVSATVISLAYRGQGLSEKLNDALEAELRAKGYEYLSRDAVRPYADHLAEKYGDRVINKNDFEAALGPTSEMKIKL
jgi:predicted GNAT family acetyltransferase